MKSILIIDSNLAHNHYSFAENDLMIYTAPRLLWSREMIGISAVYFGSIDKFNTVELRDHIARVQFTTFFTKLIDNEVQMFKLYQPSLQNADKSIHCYKITSVTPAFTGEGRYLSTVNTGGRVHGYNTIRDSINIVYKKEHLLPSEHLLPFFKKTTEPEHYINAQCEILVIPSLVINEGEFLL